MYMPPFKVLQTKTRFASNPQPLRDNMQREIFKCKTLIVLLTLQRIYQGQAEHDTVLENS